MNARQYSQAGVTLIELMIGLAIGTLVILAALSLLLNITNASARVYQTQELSDAMRSALGLVEQNVIEAGFGISDSVASINVVPGGNAADASNSMVLRIRPVAEPMMASLPPEIVACTYGLNTVTGRTPTLRATCNGTPATIATGVVAFEVHSGCADSLVGQVTKYRRGNCDAAEFRRSIRLATLVRTTGADPVRDRLVADDRYTLPTTIDSPNGSTYTVPTGNAGIDVGCEGSGDCRTYRHRLVVSEVVPRNELIRNRVTF